MTVNKDRLEVWKSHSKIDDFPLNYSTEVGKERSDEAGFLFVLDERGREVKRYAPGDWHAAGTTIICAGHSDETCDDCGTLAAGKGINEIHRNG